MLEWLLWPFVGYLCSLYGGFVSITTGWLRKHTVLSVWSLTCHCVRKVHFSFYKFRPAKYWFHWTYYFAIMSRVAMSSTCPRYKYNTKQWKIWVGLKGLLSWLMKLLLVTCSSLAFGLWTFVIPFMWAQRPHGFCALVTSPNVYLYVMFSASLAG